jgi:serine/threonine protein kinase/tetratricopeptide (TPR) repeat protein
MVEESFDEKAVFNGARRIQSHDERMAYLQGACAQYPEALERVLELLRVYDQEKSFLESPLAALDSTMGETITERPGTVVGPYKLIEPIGEGGMGTVWMAQQTEPVKRVVALKLVKAGMDSRQVIARFEAERQALALMDHASIARVLDAGTTGAGRPYFVMDLVKGMTITKHCDEHHLTPRQRLELFIPVCQAVQHAHQKGVIHRDLKPSNVLVALHDGKPVPKIIDFGVAKATGQSLTDRTLVTGFGNVVGTPEYMSPEQAEINQLDIDTRSDIYSLGVLLYELLAGSPPFSRKDLEKIGMLEMLRVIREEEPPKPSTKLSTAEALPTLAANRSTDPAKLTKLVRGELDWIVMKALEKDRNRRYETANGFAMDVQRYLADEPVLACPPSVGYRLRKFVRRKRRALSVAVCLAVAAGVTTISVSWQLRNWAMRRGETERTVMAALAQAETFNAEGWKQIDDPDAWRATVRLAQSAVDRAEGLVATGVATDELMLQVRMARAAIDATASANALHSELDRIRLEESASYQRGFFRFANAAPLYAAAFRTYGIEPGAAAAESVRSSPLREVLTTALEDWARISPNPEERRHVRELLSAVEPNPDNFSTRWQESRENGEALAELVAHTDVRSLSRATVSMLAADLYHLRELSAAIQLLQAGQERWPQDFWLNYQLGVFLDNEGRSAEAVTFLRVAVALRSRNASAHQALAVALRRKGDLDGAIRQLQQALDIDPEFSRAHNSLGLALFDKKEIQGALHHTRRAIELDPNDAVCHYNLGTYLGETGELDEAIRYYRRALDLNPKHFGAQLNLGLAMKDKGELEAAIQCFLRALDCEDAKKSWAHTNLGNACWPRTT